MRPTLQSSAGPWSTERRRRHLLALATTAALAVGAAVPLWPGAAGAAAPRTTELVSRTAAGALGNGGSTQAAVSDDGSVAAVVRS